MKPNLREEFVSNGGPIQKQLFWLFFRLLFSVMFKGSKGKNHPQTPPWLSHTLFMYVFLWHTFLYLTMSMRFMTVLIFVPDFTNCAPRQIVDSVLHTMISAFFGAWKILHNIGLIGHWSTPETDTL